MANKTDKEKNEENSIRDIFVKPGLINIAENVLLFLDVKSLITCRSVSHTWNDIIREFINRKFLRLEDIVLLPAMSHEYKKQHMGGTLDYRGEDMLEEMASNLVCYHVRGLKKGEAVRAVVAKVQVLPHWREKTYEQLMRSKSFEQIGKAINTALRNEVMKELFPAASGLHKKAENSI